MLDLDEQLHDHPFLELLILQLPVLFVNKPSELYQFKILLGHRLLPQVIMADDLPVELDSPSVQHEASKDVPTELEEVVVGHDLLHLGVK